jgi:hypothetical protein
VSRATAWWRRLRQGSGERGRRGERGRAWGREKEGLDWDFIEKERGRVRDAREVEMVAGVMAFMESGIKGKKNGSIKLHYDAGRKTVAVKLLYSP